MIVGLVAFRIAVLLHVLATTQILAQNRQEELIVTNFFFAMPSYWIVIPEKSDYGGQLLFRRYSVALRRQAIEDAKSGNSKQLQIIGAPGMFYNTMIYNCQRDQRKSDFLTFHIPDELSPSSFRRDERVPQLAIRVLIDRVSMTYDAEYIKGDIFLDASSTRETGDFLRLLNAAEIIVEFGDQKDRLNLFVGDTLGNAKLADFVREALPPLLKLSPNTLRFLNNAEMLRICMTYKKTGHF
jgi:hypothetical protein